MVGPCSYCGPYNQYCGHQPNNTNTYYWPVQYETDYTCSSYGSSYSPPVDCTLSLGPPSARVSSNNVDNDTHYYGETTRTTTTTKHRNSVSSFCWNLLHSNKSSSDSNSKPSRSSGGGSSGSVGGVSDPLFARRCSNCDTTSTPLWRNGPRGPKSLCNACGIRFKKEERRAAAATTTALNNNATSAGIMDRHHGHYHGPWAHQYTQGTPQKVQCYGTPNEFHYMEDDHGSDSNIQLLSWLTHDRPGGRVHDFIT